MYTLYPCFDSQVPPYASQGLEQECSADLREEKPFMREVTDLTAQGHYTHVDEYIPFRQSLRFRTLHRWRPARRSRVRCGETVECEPNENASYFQDFVTSIKSIYQCLFLCCGTNRVGNRWFGFVMTRGPRHIYLSVVRKRPIFAMYMWCLLLICETTMVVLYLVQVSQIEKDVTWACFAPKEFSPYFYASSALSILLLSQLIFAYSFAPITIVVVLVTTIYQIILLVVARGFGFGWASRMYVPLFLRCWPMRQYFLFLLDSVDRLTPKSSRLDIVRLAAPSLSMFFTTVFSAACIFQLQQVLHGTGIGMIDSMYFVMTTISTTGFGDVLPQGDYGRTLTMGIIFIFLAKMPSWIMVVVQTVQLLRSFPQYDGTAEHYIVYGHVSHEDAVSILDEVFALDPTKCVCFCNTNFSRDVLALGRHPRYRMRSKFMVVKGLDKRTLHRMRVSEADAIMISPTSDGTAKALDDDVLLSSVTFQRHAPHVQQYVKLRFGAHVKLLRGRKTVVDQNMRSIMATALLLPGIVPFLVNLVRISSRGGTTPPTLWSEAEMDNWKELYEYSRRTTFGAIPSPWYFAQCRLRTVVQKMKEFNVLAIGVEEGKRRLMLLDLDYTLENGDTLLVLYEGGRDTLTRALEALEPNGILNEQSQDGGSKTDGMRMASSATDVPTRATSLQDMLNTDIEELTDPAMEDAALFYPFNKSFEATMGSHWSAGSLRAGCNARADQACKGALDPASKLEGTTERGEKPLVHQKAATEPDTSAFEHQVQELRRRLLGHSFVNKCPGGISLAHLPLGGSLVVLTYLLNLHKAGHTSTCPVDSSFERLEQQINDILHHVSEDYRRGVTTSSGGENFLFIDHVSSFKQPLLESMYDHYLNEHASRFELLQMMRCIRGIYSHSRVTLLSWQRLSSSFLQWWDASFEYPLRYIRGMSTMESHLNYAIKESGGAENLRGILLYCSQLGQWDFADVPLVTVENNIRAILEWALIQQERHRISKEEAAGHTEVEQQVMVELKSFKSCVHVTPHHTDVEWRQRGEVHFQYSLAFMMGRCFSTNMLKTLFVHAHHNHFIMDFFENVLCLHRQGNVFDAAGWNSGDKSAPTLFKACGNHLLHFQTFGDFFMFLLKHQSWVAIGVFRRFPPSEGLSGMPRYFVANPPKEMLLKADDIIYALSGAPGQQNRAE